MGKDQQACTSLKYEVNAFFSKPRAEYQTDEYFELDLPVAPAEDYLQVLKHSEKFKNPEGQKGGVFGICKAVYSGLREQKIK